MRSGRLRHLVEIHNPTGTADDMGGHSNVYASVESVWADISPLTAREFFQNQQVQSNVTHRVRMRHTDNLTTSSRLIFGTRTLHVTKVRNPSERSKMIEAFCVEDTD